MTSPLPGSPLVLIVDDNEKNLRLHRDVLRAAGVETLEAATGAEAIALATAHTPDVILMDINLPDKSGIDLCKEVKARYPAIRILGLSSFNQQSFIEKMMENGASGYVLKNATREELIEAVVTGARLVDQARGQNLCDVEAEQLNARRHDRLILRQLRAVAGCERNHTSSMNSDQAR